MEIKFQGQYTKDVFFTAVRLANQPARNQKRFLWFMLLFAVGALILLLYRIIDTQDFGGNAILLGAAVIMVIVVGGIFFQPHFTARKLWRNPGVRRVLKGVVSNRGITYNLEVGKNEIAWNRITRIRMKDDLVTLVRSDGLLLVFPRQFFSRDSDWGKLLKLVEKMVGSRNNIQG
jgi:hypothetical protein